MLVALVADFGGDVSLIELGEFREAYQDAGDGGEDAIDDSGALGWCELREGDFEVAQADAAEARDGEIEQACVEAREWVGKKTRGERERVQHAERQQVFKQVRRPPLAGLSYATRSPCLALKGRPGGRPRTGGSAPLFPSCYSIQPPPNTRSPE